MPYCHTTCGEKFMAGKSLGGAPTHKSLGGISSTKTSTSSSRADNRSSLIPGKADYRKYFKPAESQSIAETNYVVATIKSMTNAFAAIDDKVIMENYNQAIGNGNMSVEDRTVTFETAYYLYSNMGYLILSLLSENDIKDAALKVIAYEQSMDQQPAEEKKRLRAEVDDGISQHESLGHIVLGVTTFVPALQKELQDALDKSFEKIMAFEGEVDKLVNDLSYAQKLEYGAIFGNFMYLIRAFSYNGVFFNYIISIIEGVKKLIEV